MISVYIGGEQVYINDLDESWVNREIRRLSRDSYPVCVRVTIDEGNVKLNLSTPGCPQSGGSGGSRPPSEAESEILTLWRKRRLDSNDFTGGELIAFLNQLRNLL